MDELIVEAFNRFAGELNDELCAVVERQPALPALRAYVTRQLNLSNAAARIWMSAWVAAPRRPALAQAVDRQLLAGLDLLTGLLERGGVFSLVDARASAFRILVLIDGILVQISMRAEKTYGDVSALVWETVEREVGLRPRMLSGVDTHPPAGSH